MIIGLLLLLLPVALYLATFRSAGRLAPRLCWLYRIVAGLMVFGGGAASLYFAAYTGDQGGITAFFLQLTVIFLYAFFSALLLIANWLLRNRSGGDRL